MQCECSTISLLGLGQGQIWGWTICVLTGCAGPEGLKLSLFQECCCRHRLSNVYSAQLELCRTSLMAFREDCREMFSSFLTFSDPLNQGQKLISCHGNVTFYRGLTVIGVSISSMKQFERNLAFFSVTCFFSLKNKIFIYVNSSSLNVFRVM